VYVIEKSIASAILYMYAIESRHEKSRYGCINSRDMALVPHNLEVIVE